MLLWFSIEPSRQLAVLDANAAAFHFTIVLPAIRQSMPVSANADEESPEPGVLEAARREKLRKIADLGIDPWGGRFDGRSLIGEIRRRGHEVQCKTEAGKLIDVPEVESVEVNGKPTWVLVDRSGPQQRIEFRQWVADQGRVEFVGPHVRAAGRIVLSREQGKLRFIDIQDWTGKIQLFVGRQQVGDENWKLVECLDLGDIIGVDGQLRRTKMGELSIFAQQLYILCKSLQPPPAKHVGLIDPELRQRQRYVDLAYNDGVLDRFLNRTKIVQSIRSTLANDGFCEIEGPILHAVAGGAAARPFVTHHNALDLQLYLRIALELHLKRLLVGGMERVYELGRVYRNEGISPKHNPEFTMLEVYQAYGDYRSMMDLTERLITDAIRAIDGQYKRPWGNSNIDFTPPFARTTYDDLFQQSTGVAANDITAVKACADQMGLETAGKHPDVIKNEVFEEKVEPALAGPIFVQDYPASICPLTKRKPDRPELAERFELFIQGMEVANAYTELNDPDLQEKLFQTQLAGLPEDESMAKMDRDFIRALRHGMPPAGGLGVGIDRLVMLLTNSQTIREVILFPLLRPES